MLEITQKKCLLLRILIYLSGAILFFSLWDVVVFASDQNLDPLDRAIRIIDEYRKKLSEGKEISEDEWQALGILGRKIEKEEIVPEEHYPVVYQQEGDYGKGRYQTIQGTQQALGTIIEEGDLCGQKLIDNYDGLTFTYKRRTKEGFIEKWVFLKNANPFYWAYYWKDVNKKLVELDVPEKKIKYQLPPSKVLIEIVTLAKACPVEVSSITATDIKIFNTETVVPYWANEEYFYSESETTQHAAIVSLYYAKRGRLNKNEFAIIWPCYLESREIE